jgi:hypothetical protein
MQWAQTMIPSQPRYRWSRTSLRVLDSGVPHRMLPFPRWEKSHTMLAPFFPCDRASTLFARDLAAEVETVEAELVEEAETVRHGDLRHRKTVLSTVAIQKVGAALLASQWRNNVMVRGGGGGNLMANQACAKSCLEISIMPMQQTARRCRRETNQMFH